MDYDVLTATSAVFQGRGTLDFFLYTLNEYQKRLEEKSDRPETVGLAI